MMASEQLTLRPLTDYTPDQARRLKWNAGREKYGDSFQGDPLNELYGELIDALNYTKELRKTTPLLPTGPHTAASLELFETMLTAMAALCHRAGIQRKRNTQ